MPRKDLDRPFPAHKPPSIVTRTSIVDGLKTISRERWEEFVDIYSPLIRYWIGHSKVSESDVDDIFQDSLTAIYTSIGRFDRLPTKHFRGWIRTIVSRRVTDHGRKKKRRKQELLHDSLESMDDNWDDAAYVAAYSQTKARVYERIKDVVTARTFEMYWQHSCEERVTEEVARSFGISQAGVRMAVRRVLKVFKSRHFTREDLVD